jgi:uncharacterized SAM-binding protein YcdF (DUF218 family)
VSACFVIFGAAVRPDGTPGMTLRRRVETALRLAQSQSNSIFLATGGVGRHGPAEAQVIFDLLVARGIDPARILIEDRASDTLESVLFCDEILRRHGLSEIVTCSSGYHAPRCALLFRILGYKVAMGRTQSDRPHLGWPRYLAYVLKESIALPYDAALLLGRVGLARFFNPHAPRR